MGAGEYYTIKDIDFRGKKVLLRVDYNVPVDDNGVVLNDFRIKASLPTIKQLFIEGAKQVILISHLGRPSGEEAKYSLKNVSQRLFELTKRKVEFVPDTIHVEDLIPEPKEASLVVLENLRFRPEEERNDADFAKKLSKYADIYVNDAFAVCHRNHASVDAITHFLPGCVGLLVEKELNAFDTLINSPEHPFVGIIGGSKLETKLPLINNLLEKVDRLLLGGAMIFTFFRAQGMSVGKSLVSRDYIDMARMLANNEKIVLPKDVVVADGMEKVTYAHNMLVQNMPSYLMGLDVGSESVELFKRELHDARMVIFNGPLGYYENPLFEKATKDVLVFLARNPQIKTIIGGGDTASLAHKFGLQDSFFHVSTGGGASLVLLEGKPLPGLEGLRRKRG